MKKAILLVSFISVLFISCTSEPTIPYTYQPPENISDGLDTGTLAEVHIDSVPIEQAVNEINRGKYKEVHSMLIFKDNKLVLEEYFTGHEYVWEAANHHGEQLAWDRTRAHPLHSVTKSITSTCIGIAIDRGFIESVDQSIFDYLPEHQHLNTDGKEKITIEHLLTMTSAFSKPNVPVTGMRDSFATCTNDARSWRLNSATRRSVGKRACAISASANRRGDRQTLSHYG